MQIIAIRIAYCDSNNFKQVKNTPICIVLETWCRLSTLFSNNNDIWSVYETY